MFGKKNRNRIDWSLGFSLMAGMVGIVVVWWLMFKPDKEIPTSFYFGSEVERYCFNNICLDKNGEGWIVSDSVDTFPANNDLATTYAKKFGSLSLGELVSINRERFFEMGIGETNPIVLEINSKKLELGRINTDYDGVYVRIPDEDKIYNSKVLIDKNTIINFKYWQNKTVTNIPISEIKKIRVEKGKLSAEIGPVEGRFANQVWVEKVANLGAIGFVKMTEPIIISTMMVETDKEMVEIKVGQQVIDKKNSRYWATVDNEFYYEINREDFKTLTDKIN